MLFVSVDKWRGCQAKKKDAMPFLKYFIWQIKISMHKELSFIYLTNDFADDG